MDLFDALRGIDLLLGREPPPTDYESCAGDLDGDGDVDIFDMLDLIDILLGRP